MRVGSEKEVRKKPNKREPDKIKRFRRRKRKLAISYSSKHQKWTEIRKILGKRSECFECLLLFFLLSLSSLSFCLYGNRLALFVSHFRSTIFIFTIRVHGLFWLRSFGINYVCPNSNRKKIINGSESSLLFSIWNESPIYACNAQWAWFISIVNALSATKLAF